MPKVGIYCRLSIEDKDKSSCDDSQSIQNQKNMLRDYCHEREWEIYDIYCDDGYSGIDRARPDFNRLLADCEKGKIDIVLCKDQSRFSRDIIVIEQYINDKFLEWGVRFIGVADNADSENELYGTMRLFTSAYNEMYVKDISAKIRRTLAYKRQQGQFIGSFAPYGYMIDPSDKHHLIIDEEAAENIRQIFNMYVEGNGYRKIANELNSNGIASPSAYKKQNGSKYINTNAVSSNSMGLWTQSTIASILRNETYIGTLVQGKSHNISYKNKKRKQVGSDDWIRIPNSHEAIIDMEVWERAQERLKSNTRSSRGTQELSPLSGKVKCMICGSPMKRNVYYNKSGTLKYYGLQCATYKSGAMNCSNCKSISGKVLEQKIIDELNAIIKQYCEADKITIDNIYKQQEEKLRSALNSLTAQQSTAKCRLTKMYKDKLDGLLSDEDYALFRESLAEEEKQLTERIEEINMQIEKCRTQQINTESQKELIEKYTEFTQLDRNIADEFIDYIEIGAVTDDGNREIHIHWKI